MQRFAVSGILVLILAGPGSAPAAILTLESATISVTLNPVPVLEVNALPNLPVFVSSGDGSFVLPSQVISGTDTFTLGLFTGVTLISSATMTVANQQQTFFAGGGPNGGFGGPGLLAGEFVVQILGGLLNIEVPLSVVGGGGVATGGFGPTEFIVTAPLSWTTGAAVITGVNWIVRTPTSLGYSAIVSTLSTVTLSGFDSRDAAHRGTISLVTPFRVTTGFAGNLGGFAVTTLRFVPEPGILMLVAAAVVGLSVLGRRRSR